MEKVILVIVLFICLFTDIRSRKILNIVTLPAIVFGLFFYLSTTGFEGFLFSGKGFLVGLGLLIIPYILGGMGAGDVKLMAAIGALMGTGFVFYAFIYTALFGGVIGLLLIIKQRGIVNLMKSSIFTLVFFRSNLGSIIIEKDKQSSISFPYGIAIVLGTFCTLIWGGF
ncbi:peptidase A24A prepilin type IV [Neobacillus bataviensis LMG 21833]|uniref:Peptidase A24A prepilin type IV n=1 Tax=Neobacillus bataviensis LMG 21833 TaxID=1117379 RepID=K6CQN2_9BACI|nr:prepilin peptidase [Neobacillus bataviensis]EKN62547.1 peptidase A24A prepilin type IV [Neobacillus bataviensis LMG 21833]